MTEPAGESGGLASGQQLRAKWVSNGEGIGRSWLAMQWLTTVGPRYARFPLSGLGAGPGVFDLGEDWLPGEACSTVATLEVRRRGVRRWTGEQPMTTDGFGSASRAWPQPEGGPAVQKAEHRKARGQVS